MIWCIALNLKNAVGSNLLSELSALINGKLWLFLAIIAIGSGGLFAVFSYIKPILTDVAYINIEIVPFILLFLGWDGCR